MAVVPVYNMLLTPDSNVYFRTDQYKRMTGKPPIADERVILAVLRDNLDKDEIRQDSFYPIGVSGIITEINPEGFFTVRTRSRINLDEVTVYPDHTIDLSISRRPSIDDMPEEEQDQKTKEMKARLLRTSQDMEWGPAVQGYIGQWTSLAEIACAMSPWMLSSNAERYAVLAEDSTAKRTEMLEQMILENMELLQINKEAKTAQEEDYQRMYRESALRKQIEYLQKELDAMHPEEMSDLRRLELKVEESEMNEDARKEAKKVLNRLKQEGQNSAESGLLYDYMDFLTNLPWKKTAQTKVDLAEAEEILNESHYGLKKVKRRIIEQLAVNNLKQQQSGSILLFVGAPGTGKTSIGAGIAKALNRKYIRVSLGGVRDEADIRGHRRTYIGAMAGRIMNGISKAGVTNPVMVLDEIDKLSSSYNGDPASALLEVLDPEQNAHFTDHYMNVPYDLSDVLFICTANSLDTVPEPLLNRCEVIQFQGYSPIEKLQIAKEHLLPKAMRQTGIKPENLSVSDEVLNRIVTDYTAEGGVRGLKKRLDTLCRMAAVELVKGNEEQVVVEEKDLRHFLDMHPMRHGKVKDSARPGIVTGLAWTAVGGEILYMETLLSRGSGKISVTGRLGDVMKESVQLAVSLVKSMYPERAEVFEKNDLHIHVPDGSTPKDGPSAGITMTTALASLVTDTPVDPHVAMTGEISLKGGVNPIGGLPEKLLAAQRAGVTRVFIPKDNEEDLEDVAEEVRNALTIIPVEAVAEVLEQLGIKVPETNLHAV